MSLTRFFSALTFISFFFSCGTKPDTFQKEEEEASSSIVKESEEKNIVFLYFEMTKKENNVESITLTQTQVVSGSIKENSINNKHKAEGNLMILFLTENGTVLEERIIENPLNFALEQYDEEGIQTQQVTLKKGYFHVRYNQNPAIKSIHIQKIQQNGNLSLFTQNL